MKTDEFGEITMPFIRTAYNYDTDKASRDSGLTCPEETMTQQQFRDECDINTIVERFGLTGMVPTNVAMPLESGFLDVIDYQTALNKLREADNVFSLMPAEIRDRFGNDAGKFVNFISDEKNKDQAKAWGLTRPETPPQAPIDVRVIPDPSQPTKTA